MVEAHIQGQRASVRCDWVETCHTSKSLWRKCRTLTAIQLTSIRDDVRCCAPRSSHPVTSWERRTASPYEISEATDEECMAGECWKELQGRMSMWASLCPPVCPSICHSECWKEWQCESSIMMMSLMVEAHIQGQRVSTRCDFRALLIWWHLAERRATSPYEIRAATDNTDSRTYPTGRLCRQFVRLFRWLKRGLDYQSRLWMWVSNTTFLPPHRWDCSLLYFQARNLSKKGSWRLMWMTHFSHTLCVLVKGGLSQVRKSTQYLCSILIRSFCFIDWIFELKYFLCLIIYSLNCVWSS